MRTIRKPNRENLMVSDRVTGANAKKTVKKGNTVKAGAPSGKYVLTCTSASHIINRYTLASTAVGALPMPGADVVAVSAIQVDLVEELAHIYGLHISREQGKRLAVMVVGAMTVSVGARSVFSALKAVPLIGTVVGGGTSAVTAALTTYAIGRAVANHFEHGGTLRDIMTPIQTDAAVGHGTRSCSKPTRKTR
jgi:uncharacterized protein (DUF697 family)